MKITKMEGIIWRLPMRQPVADGTLEDLLIRIETAEVLGFGKQWNSKPA
jgi:hypothetical protein